MDSRIIDLTFPLHEGMTTFPAHWHPMVEITQLGRHGIENRETRKVTLGTHTGTHCDAPRHFIPGGLTIDQLPLEPFIGPAYLLDLTFARPGQAIGVADLQARLKDRPIERLLLRFDWSDHWGSREYYADHPYLSTESARWLLDRGLRLLGMDTPMPDNPAHGWQNPVDSPVHKLFLVKNVPLVEYLCHLREIKTPEFYLIALPLNILGGDGAPVRCVAIEGADVRPTFSDIRA
jgi:kynurenine formamidase